MKKLNVVSFSFLFLFPLLSVASENKALQPKLVTPDTFRFDRQLHTISCQMSASSDPTKVITAKIEQLDEDGYGYAYTDSSLGGFGFGIEIQDALAEEGSEISITFSDENDEVNQESCAFNKNSNKAEICKLEVELWSDPDTSHVYNVLCKSVVLKEE